MKDFNDFKSLVNESYPDIRKEVSKFVEGVNELNPRDDDFSSMLMQHVEAWSFRTSIAMLERYHKWLNDS